MTCSLRQNIVDDLELNNLVKHDGEGFKITGPLNAVQEKQDKYFRAVEDEYRATEDVFFVDGDYVKFNEPLLEAIYRKDNGVIAPPTDEAVSAEFELLQSVNMILTKLGLTSKSVDKLRDRDGNPIKGVAVADILNRSIQYLEGKQEEVPEEVIHFFVQALKELNDPLYISMAERVHKEPEYAEVLTTYSDLGYSEEDLLDEAIAKVILKRTVEKIEEDRNTRWWGRVKKKLQSVFNSDKSDPFMEAAKEMFQNDLSRYANAISTSKRETLFRSVESQQEVIRGKLVFMHNDLEIIPVTRDQLTGNMTSDQFDILSRESADGTIGRYRQASTGKISTWRGSDKGPLDFARKNPTYKTVRDPLANSVAKYGTKYHSVMQALNAFWAVSETVVYKGKDKDGKDISYSYKDLFNVVELDGVLSIKDGEIVRVSKDEGLPALTLESLFKASGLDVDSFKRMSEAAKEIILDVAMVQVELNKASGSKDKTDIYSELKVKLDSEDKAGTIDLLFVLSDSSTAIFDYKFTAPYNWKAPSLPSEPFNDTKIEGFESQMAFYNDALRNLGINPRRGVRRSRIVPGAIKLIVDEYTGDILGVKSVSIGSKSDKFLSHIPILGELADTDIHAELETMNRTLRSMGEELEKLKGLRLSPAQIRRKTALRASIRALLTRSELTQTTNDIKTLYNSLREDMKITDPKNPKYLTRNMLNSGIEMIEIYKNVPSAIDKKSLKTLSEKEYDALEEGDKKRYDETIQKREELAEYVSKLQALQDELESILINDVYDNEGFTLNSVNSPLVAAHKFLSFNESGNELINFASKTIDDAKARADNDYREFADIFIGLDKGLKEWAKANGKSAQQAYNMIHRSTKTGKKLIKIFSEDFTKARNKALEDYAGLDTIKKDAALKWMKEHYTLKENATADYASFLAAKEKELLAKYGSTESNGYKDSLKRFKSMYDVQGNRDAWASKTYYKFLEVKPELLEDNYSAEYKELKKGGNEPLLNYYEAFQAAMTRFDALLYGASIPYNMIPNVHASTIEKWMSGAEGWESMKANIASTFKIDVEDEYSGSDNTRKSIPLRYMNPLRNSKGEIDPNLVSSELTPSILHFAMSVFQNHRKSEVEGTIMMAKRLLEKSSEGVWKKDKSGNEILIKEGEGVRAVSAETVAKMDKLIQMKLYDMGLGSTATGKKFQFAMSAFSKIIMTLPFKSSLAAVSAGFIFGESQLKSNPNFGEASLTDSFKLMFSDSKKFDAITDYFNIYQEGELQMHSRVLRHNPVERWVNSDYLYSPLRQADEMGDRRMFIAMLHNFHLNEKGEFERLINMPEGTKSVIEQFEMKDGVLTNKILPEQKSRIERMFKAEMSAVRGNNTPENIAEYQSEIALSVMMQFKSWMPPMILARYGKVSYDRTMEKLKEGRYSGSLKALKLKHSPNEVMEGVATNLLLQSVSEKAYNVIASLISDRNYTLTSRERERLKKGDSWGKKQEANFQSRRARYQAELDLLKQNSNDKNVINMGIEEFLQMREASVRSTLFELKAILMMMLTSMLLSLAMEDDDEDSYLERQTADLLRRTLMEIAMFANPMEVLKINNGVPVLGLLSLAANIGGSFADAGWNAVTGQSSEKDLDKIIKTSFKIVPGNNTYRWIIGESRSR